MGEPTPLAPTGAAKIAQTVYGIQTNEIDDALQQDSGLGKAFKESDFPLEGVDPLRKRIKGSTGVMWFRGETGMGLGTVGAGSREGEQILYYGVVKLIEVSKWILRLVARILRFVGRAVIAVADVTLVFLRWLLKTLAQVPEALANNAMLQAMIMPWGSM